MKISVKIVYSARENGQENVFTILQAPQPTDWLTTMHICVYLCVCVFIIILFPFTKMLYCFIHCSPKRKWRGCKALHSDYYVSESNNVNWLKIHCCTALHAANVRPIWVECIEHPCDMRMDAGVPAAMRTLQNCIKFMHRNY